MFKRAIILMILSYGCLHSNDFEDSPYITPNRMIQVALKEELTRDLIRIKQKGDLVLQRSRLDPAVGAIGNIFRFFVPNQYLNDSDFSRFKETNEMYKPWQKLGSSILNTDTSLMIRTVMCRITAGILAHNACEYIANNNTVFDEITAETKELPAIVGHLHSLEPERQIPIIEALKKEGLSTRKIVMYSHYIGLPLIDILTAFEQSLNKDFKHQEKMLQLHKMLTADDFVKSVNEAEEYLHNIAAHSGLSIYDFFSLIKKDLAGISFLIASYLIEYDLHVINNKHMIPHDPYAGLGLLAPELLIDKLFTAAQESYWGACQFNDKEMKIRCLHRSIRFMGYTQDAQEGYDVEDLESFKKLWNSINDKQRLTQESDGANHMSNLFFDGAIKAEPYLVRILRGDLYE
jgi:hypothetical protein